MRGGFAEGPHARAEGELALIVVDTDVLIDALAGIEPSATLVARELRSGRLATTAVTRFELLAGAGAGDDEARLHEFLLPLAVLPFDREAADRAARVAVILRSEGRSIPMADLAIAGICLELGASLLTRNRLHFERIEGLRLEAPS